VSVDLNENVFSGFAAVEKPKAPTLAMNGIENGKRGQPPISVDLPRPAA
jgi:hypothetical protein